MGLANGGSLETLVRVGPPVSLNGMVDTEQLAKAFIYLAQARAKKRSAEQNEPED
jgi:hypothetical protein